MEHTVLEQGWRDRELRRKITTVLLVENPAWPLDWSSVPEKLSPI